MRTTLAAALVTLLATAAPLAAQAPTAARGADSAYFRSDYAVALAGYRDLVKRDTANAIAWFRIARTYARLGDREAALTYLDSAATSAVVAGSAGPTVIRDEPDFASLKSDAQFMDVVKRVDAVRHPCPGGAQTTQFDFWIGVWNVSPWNTPGAPPAAAGVNDVHPILEHCVIFENWTGNGGGNGKSFNFFDTNVGKWRQVWVADGGGSLDYTGEFRDGAMRFEGWTLGTNGQRVLQKLTFTPFGRDTVRQTFEASTDAGTTWTTGFDGRYVRQRSP